MWAGQAPSRATSLGHQGCIALSTPPAPDHPPPTHLPAPPRSEGKSLLYTAAAGVPPHQILPVTLDVGTNNAALLDDPAYGGLRQRRVTGADYDALVEEFIAALKAWQPHVLLQFEVRLR